MAAIVTLTEIKEHLRINGMEEDTLLSTYADAAGEYVRAFTGASWEPLAAPASVAAAVLLLVGDLYENREAQTAAPLHANTAVERLLWPHRLF